VLNAFLLGAVAQSTLLLAGLLVYWVKVPPRVIGWLAGFGAGSLISAVAFDLIEQADLLGATEMMVWLVIGTVIFLGGERLIEQRFGEEAGALGIVLGSVVDGVPESAIFGTQLALGAAVSPAFLFSVMVSNLPQALAPSADLAASGWKIARMAAMWAAVVVACGVASAVLYLLATNITAVNGNRAAAIAAGGLLAMITNSLIPFSYERGGILTGFFTALGFAVSFLMA
jgi:ZIP family zinc transporter